ncbi:MAG: HAD family hydrolase [Selenomonadaceae bacterium]|nr:HAD family hydrolase [Selenomonadaceae bacterium]
MTLSAHNIKLVAVDIDGTFVRRDYSYDVPRFERILERMNEAGARFVVASGNQYYQLRDLFPTHHEQMAFVAENGAFVKDRSEMIFTADMPKSTVEHVIDVCRKHPEIRNVLCGVKSAYCERGSVDQAFFELTAIYYHRLQWVDDFKAVDDRILKFAPTVPEEKLLYYYDLFRAELDGRLEAVTSGHDSIDLIVPGCHKASGLKRLVERWGITPDQCAAFGDGGNDIEMLRYCGQSYAMDNASDEVKAAAKYVCPSNEADGVLVTLDKLF